MKVKALLLLLLFSFSSSKSRLHIESEIMKPLLLKQVSIPEILRTKTDGLDYGGDIRIGDLDNDQNIDFLVYRAAHFISGGATQPCFIAAFNLEGEVLWTKGKDGLQPNRPGPVAVFDIDNDGKTEVITLFVNDGQKIDPQSMRNVSVQIIDGATGNIKKESSPIELTSSYGSGPNWVHQRILITNLRGTEKPQDFIIKLGKKIIAFDDKLNVLWTYWNEWDEYGNCPAYTPSVGDMDNDGKDEINGGFYILSSNGKPLWEKKNAVNMDAVTIDFWDNPIKKRAFGSGYGQVFDEKGTLLLKLGESLVPHGQELRVANFDNESPGNEMIIRYNGHKENVLFVNNKGEIVHTFKLNESPNNTGMESVYWSGFEKSALLYNGGMLWTARGSFFKQLPHLPIPKGNFRQGWYHCIPVNFKGDDSEEIVIYNPWDSEIYIYGNELSLKLNYRGYANSSRQYNVRLLD